MLYQDDERGFGIATYPHFCPEMAIDDLGRKFTLVKLPIRKTLVPPRQPGGRPTTMRSVPSNRLCVQFKPRIGAKKARAILCRHTIGVIRSILIPKRRGFEVWMRDITKIMTVRRDLLDDGAEDVIHVPHLISTADIWTSGYEGPRRDLPAGAAAP